MDVWLSVDLRVVLSEANLADDIEIEGITYRKASPEWLTWLRSHGRGVDEKKDFIRGVLAEHCPQVIGKKARIDSDYAPPEWPEYRWIERVGTEDGVQAPEWVLRTGRDPFEASGGRGADGADDASDRWRRDESHLEPGEATGLLVEPD